ncbi:MAG: hypothetical protein ACI97A_003851 [Planctomycetota bacterium]|jgi:hypothetical protein
MSTALESAVSDSQRAVAFAIVLCEYAAPPPGKWAALPESLDRKGAGILEAGGKQLLTCFHRIKRQHAHHFPQNLAKSPTRKMTDALASGNGTSMLKIHECTVYRTYCVYRTRSIYFG